FQVTAQDVLVFHAGVIGADHDPQTGHESLPILVVVGGWLWSGRPSTAPAVRAQRAKESAPASGVPRLRSASGRARPTRGFSRAVACAAWSAASAAAAHAADRWAPASVCRSRVSTNGTRASTMVLSPTLALPREVMASSPARTAAATVLPVISAESSPRR